jgi:hypothetical protein
MVDRSLLRILHVVEINIYEKRDFYISLRLDPPDNKSAKSNPRASL